MLLALTDEAPQSLQVTPLVGLLSWLLLGWATLRLSLVLAAIALDRPLGLREAWAASRPASGTIAMVALVLAVTGVVLEIVLQQLEARRRLPVAARPRVHPHAGPVGARHPLRRPGGAPPLRRPTPPPGLPLPGP